MNLYIPKKDPIYKTRVIIDISRLNKISEVNSYPLTV